MGAAALQGVQRLTPRDMKACTPHLAIISSPESLHLCQRCQNCPLSMQLVACEEPAASNQRLPVSLTDYHGHRHRHLLHWPLHSVTACCMAGLMRVVWTERCDLPLLKTCISLLRATIFSANDNWLGCTQSIAACKRFQANDIWHRRSHCTTLPGLQGAARTPTSAQRQLRKPPDTEPAWGMRARPTTGVSAAGQSTPPPAYYFLLCTSTVTSVMTKPWYGS